MLVRIALAALFLVAGCTAPPRPADAPRDAERPEWAQAFTAVDGQGTFVLFYPATGRTERHDPARAARRYLPASTFKLYNALVALDAGVVTDVDSLWAWDGVERSIPAWNRDHSLRTGMAASTVWLYQRLAGRVGRERYAAAFAREPYGNAVTGDTLAQFWLDNSLRISADEQVRFADRLRTGRTGFSDAAEWAVREIVPVLAERPGARLLGKTGWGGFSGAPGVRTQLGWVVGWVERPAAAGDDVVFALNVEPLSGAAGAGFEMGPARLAIATAILEAEGMLPPAGPSPAGDAQRAN